MRQEDIQKLLEVGVLLSAERDLDRLLERILTCAMELTACDAGTLYLLKDDALHFRTSRNNTLQSWGSDGLPPPVPLTRQSVCALALLEDKTIRIEDVKNCRLYDLTGPIRYDEQTGYDTRSMLVVPMRSRSGEQIGVLQLINALDEAGHICPFRDEIVLAVESVASQAAITIQNVRYMEAIQELFRSFVRVMSTAIDERTPYNAHHSRRMAQYAEGFLGHLEAQGRASFSPQRREELLMSIWLHDIGKVTTPRSVMDKAARLSPAQHSRLRSRLGEIWMSQRIECLEGRADPAGLPAFRQLLEETAGTIETIDKAGFVTDEQLAWLDGLRERTYIGPDGQPQPWLTEEEHAMLSIRRGTLSPAERREMERHVVLTDKLLAQIQFPQELSHVRPWAAAHHEKLDGSGYPKGLRGEEIPFEVRLITILDIFDALVADDRPYKPGKTVDQAANILRSMASHGELDSGLVEDLLASQCWQGIL